MSEHEFGSVVRAIREDLQEIREALDALTHRVDNYQAPKKWWRTILNK